MAEADLLFSQFFAVSSYERAVLVTHQTTVAMGYFSFLVGDSS